MKRKHCKFVNLAMPSAMSDSLSIFEEIGQLNKNLSDCEEVINSTVDGLEDLENEVAELSTTVSGYDSRIETVEETSQNLIETVATVSGSVSVLASAVNNVNNEVEELIDNMNDISSDLSSLTDTVTDNNNDSIGRDNALSMRVNLLEEATIQPITQVQSFENVLINGSDLRIPEEPYNFVWENTNNKVVFEVNKGYKYTPSASGSDNRYLRIYDVGADRFVTTVSGENLLVHKTITFMFTDNPTTLYTNKYYSGEIIKCTGESSTANISIKDSANKEFAQVQFKLGADGRYYYRIRFNSYYAGSEVNNKYLVGIKVENSNTSSGLVLDKRDYFINKRILDLLSGYTPTITPITYRKVYDDITLTSGTTTFENSKIQVALSSQVGLLGGFIAIYLQVDSSGSTIDISNGINYTLNVEDLNILPKVVSGDNISGFYSNIIGKQQFEIVAKNTTDNSKIKEFNIRLNSAAVFIPRASDTDTVGLLGVISINELVGA